MMRYSFLVSVCFILTSGYCQDKSLSGIVSDSTSLEKLIGANVLDEISKRGVIADNQGFFRLILPKNQTEVLLRVSYIGFDTKYISSDLLSQEVLNIKLLPWKGLTEITIIAPKRESMSNMVKLNHTTINAMPQLFGETDFLRTLQYFPGVLPSDESKNSLYVRGGSPDQNLILVDGIPTFYIYHLGNVSSAFNPDIISDINFSKGGFDPKYGGRLSSIIDVSMKEGNKDHLSGGYQVGMLTSRLNLQGPIVKGKTSFIISARAFYSPILQLLNSSIRYGFQDYFGKVHHEFSKRSNISGIIFHTNDLLKAGLLDVTESEKKSNYLSTGWKNNLFSIVWNYRISPAITTRTQAYHSNYQYDLGFNIDREFSKYSMNSINKALINGLDMHFSMYRNLKTSWGFQLKKYDINTGKGSFQDFSMGYVMMDTLISGFTQTPFEGGFYFNQETRITNRLRGKWGTRASFFYNDKLFPKLEPRLSLEFEVNKGVDLIFSYSRMTQPLHLISLQYSDMPTDFWMASTTNYEPELSDQFISGFNFDFNESNHFDFTAYHKILRNLIYTNQTIPIVLGNLVEREGQFFSGTGLSTGLEIMWRHNSGKLNGWISTTLSKTTRRFDELNHNQPFLFRNDRPIFLATSWVYNLDERINFSAQWFFGFGKPITIPEQKYDLNGTQYVIFDYSELNTYRMKPIHRLDIGLNYSKEKLRGISTWNFSIINLYNRQNPFFYNFNLVKTNNQNQFELRTTQTSFFFLTPSVSYRFIFN